VSSKAGRRQLGRAGARNHTEAEADRVTDTTRGDCGSIEREHDLRRSRGCGEPQGLTDELAARILDCVVGATSVIVMGTKVKR